MLLHFQVFQGNNDQETVVSHVLPQHYSGWFRQVLAQDLGQ